MFQPVKRLMIGRPIPTSEEQHQRLRKVVGLPVFASDAISSTAYATEEILVVLVPVAGFAAFGYLVPMAVLVVILLTIVVLSYRQTIYAYPSGGGSYIVSRENLGKIPALVAGSSLLADYVLTVAVSIAAGVGAITSAFADLRPFRVALCLVAIGIMMVANLRRGARVRRPVRPANVRLHLRSRRTGHLRPVPNLLPGPRPDPGPRGRARRPHRRQRGTRTRARHCSC